MKSSISLKLLRTAVVVSALLAGNQVVAQSPARSITVNGSPMNPAQIALLDAVNCGTPVPNGRYWVNWQTGAWGYEGGGQRGWIRNCQRPAQAAAGKRFIEDRVAERHGISMIHIPVYQ